MIFNPAVSSLRFDQVSILGRFRYLLVIWGPARHRGTGRPVRWPQVGWELNFPVYFSVCRAANDPQYMPGIYLGFHEWSDTGDGFCIERHAGMRRLQSHPKTTTNWYQYPMYIANGLLKNKQLSDSGQESHFNIDRTRTALHHSHGHQQNHQTLTALTSTLWRAFM